MFEALYINELLAIELLTQGTQNQSLGCLTVSL